MERKPDINQALFIKFLNGQCSEDERVAVLNWLSDPQNKVLADQMMEAHWAVLNVTDRLQEIEVKDLLKSTRDKIPEFSKSRQIKRPIKIRFQLIAACVLIVTAFSIGIFVLQSDGNRAGRHIPQEALAVHEVKTSSGEISEVVLPDGTKVRLNAQSSISYPDNLLEHANREVRLTGEAFFDVTEDAAHPFIVHTTSINIIVLGTSFNLKSYDDDATIETTLLRGKVMIENLLQPGGKVELKPSQRAIFSRATNSISLVNLQEENPVTWTEQTLQFENEELANVLRSLERWYGVSIHLENEKDASCRLTAVFDKETLVETLEIFKSLTGIDYSIAGKEVFIKGKICHQ